MTDTERFRLKDTVLVEPLINSWVAWSHLISPVPASLHLKNYQVPLLESYLADPKIHADACRERELRSGPFIDIPVERAGEVAQLLESTRQRMQPQLGLARDVFEFHNFLVREAHGQCLEDFYRELPAGLGGFVELVYDYYNRPVVRFLESLLYESPYYDESLQSLRLVEQKSDEGHSFFMNTPRLPTAGEIHWQVPFARPEVDALFRLEREPQPLGFLRDLLGLPTGAEERLRSLLTREPAPAPPPYRGDDVRLRYVGHACVLVEWQGVTILTDACVGVGGPPGSLERITYKDLPDRIDYVIVTHNHQDHFWPETLLRLRHRTGCLVVPRSHGLLYGDLSLRWLARKIGFPNVVEMETLDSIPLPDGEIIAVPFMGEHADLAHGKTGYVVRAGRRKILFGADSDCLDRRAYDYVRQILGPVDTLFLGMECVGAPLSWSCGPFLPVKPEYQHEQTRRYKGCDARRARDIADALEAERVFLYAVGLEPWYERILGLAYDESSPQLQEIKKFLAEAKETGLETSLLFGHRDIHLDPQQALRSAVAAPAFTAPVPAVSGEDAFAFD
ncbi:MAG TPA: MBL fold metallo-hydrolase [Thermoanaerobaculia bacterium]|nr:MBL fold metallo-hydrolase [Thermoanaerobaculia bacterium]